MFCSTPNGICTNLPIKHGCSEYGIQSNIVNVLANVDKIQTILFELQLVNQQLWFALKENWNINLFICQVMCDLKS